MSDRSEEDNRIHFERFLAMWMFDAGQDERSFWKTMNPTRMVLLFNARYGDKKQDNSPQSLFNYLQNGGG